MELIGTLQTYAWGKPGNSSIVARLFGGAIDPNKPYAELWMGTHPNGSAVQKGTNKPLLQVINDFPHLLGKIADYWEASDGLPFLFKVLSVNKALSIQVHPDKEMAERLHHNFPNIYHDPNHKPELAIALTEFRGLCGFRPTADIKDACVNVEELNIVIRPDLLVSYNNTTDEDFLGKIVFSLLTKGEDVVNEAVGKFLKRLQNADAAIKEKYRFDLVKKLNEEFPGDPGIFMVFFLNDVHLAPGEAVFLPAGFPHAYLSGDCIECMACSDNVVRAGLTPKFKDVETLVEILDYKSYTPQQVKLVPERISSFTTRYNPPVADFGVSRIQVPVTDTWLSPAHDSCQIFIVIEGKGTCTGERVENLMVAELKRPTVVSFADSTSKKVRTEWQLYPGTIMFLPPYSRYKFIPKAHLEMYFAYANLEFIPPHIPPIETQ